MPGDTDPVIPRETARRVLALTLDEGNGADATDVRGYLVALLQELWKDPGYFRGDQAFGNSDWEYDLYKPLIRAGLVAGSFDSGGYVEKIDTEAADRLIAAAIAELGRTHDDLLNELADSIELVATMTGERIAGGELDRRRKDVMTRIFGHTEADPAGDSTPPPGADIPAPAGEDTA